VFDGEDMSAALLGHPTTRTKPLFFEYGRNTNAFAFPRGRDRSPNVALREGDWKLLVNADGSDVQLYDLKADPKETHNIASESPDVAARLKDKALAWRNSLPKLGPNHPE
jgi:arylsulfatase A-like enzyme